MTKKHEKADSSIEVVENALGRTEQFIEDNQKIVTSVVLGIIVIVAIYLAYQKFYLKPLEEEAQSQMFVAEQYFARDSFALALDGDVNYPGFITIIDEYSATKAANLANYYAGISYLHLGQFENAIDYLKNFASDDKELQFIALGAIGDAFMELNKPEDAIKNYKNAATSEDELFAPIYLLKAGNALESLGKKDEALEVYQLIKDKYKESYQGRIIDKYITRLQLK
ncbi:MAG: tetratricopeptide repeat protein [Bacteroidales bacterium]|nr:tetratricopeptide repeat protein [Bacteroidales bacterium]